MLSLACYKWRKVLSVFTYEQFLPPKGRREILDSNQQSFMNEKKAPVKGNIPPALEAPPPPLTP